MLIRNVDVHKDFELESLKEFCKLAKRYYERADSHSNPLIVKACQYAPHPPSQRRLDPDDPITAANAQYIGKITPQSHDTLYPAVRGGEASLISRHVRASARRSPTVKIPSD